MPADIQLRRAADRTLTKTAWLNSRHSFSFGDQYDPNNTHHGVLLVNNDDVVEPGSGFDTHPHRDMEIVTWVLDGSLAHRDSAGNSGVVYPGLAQRMSAGTGILHSEKNNSTTDPVHFVQMWVQPDEPGITPSYQQYQIGDDLLDGRLVTIASGAYPAMTPPSPSTIARRRCTAHGCGPVIGSSCRRRPTCTCSSRAAVWTCRGWTTTPSWPRATPYGSPRRPARESPLGRRQRFWFGRCTRRWPNRAGPGLRPEKYANASPIHATGVIGLARTNRSPHV